MADSLPTPVTIEQIRRLRLASGLPWMECKRYLASLPPDWRCRYIEAAETQSGEPYLHDPIEDDPAIRPLFVAIHKEAEREAQEWHDQRAAELEQQAPAVADLIRSSGGRGLCHATWRRVKELMWERHSIEWHSPREMNPWITFD